MKDLPVSVCRQVIRPYRTEPRQRTPEEALDFAYADLERELSGLSSDIRILRKDLSTTITDTALILTCHLYCLEDIALQTEFEVDLS